MKNLDEQGIPGVFIASDVFVDAAEAQGRALGFDAKGVYTQHPIQDRTDGEMQEIADGVVDAIISKLLA